MESNHEIIIYNIDDFDKNKIFNELNSCFIEYRSVFNIQPDTLLFYGKYGKLFYDLVNEIFSGVYNTKWTDHYDSSIVFKNSKIKSIKTSSDSGYSRGDDMTGITVNGVPDMNNILGSMCSSFQYNIEREVIPEISFDIIKL